MCVCVCVCVWAVETIYIYVETICLQHLVSILFKHAEHFPTFSSLFFTTLPLLNIVWPINYFKFRLRLKKSIGFSGDLTATVGFIISLSQVLSKTCLTFGISMLLLVIKGMWYLEISSLYCSSSSPYLFVSPRAGNRAPQICSTGFRCFWSNQCRHYKCVSVSEIDWLYGMAFFCRIGMVRFRM